MVNKLLFSQNIWATIENKERANLGFLNMECLYYFVKNSKFAKSLNTKKSINFIDGRILSMILSFKSSKTVERVRGPAFTREFFEKKKGRDIKMFFIGLGAKDLDSLCKKYKYLDREKLFCYNPPYILGDDFSSAQVSKMASWINKSNAEYVWIAIGTPKQNILSEKLFNKTRARIFLNVGAAFDFILESKKEAPKWISEVGMEWFYRLLTDFNHSKKKVLRSLIGLVYMNRMELKK